MSLVRSVWCFLWIKKTKLISILGIIFGLILSKMDMIQTTFWLLDVYLRWNLPSRTLDFRVMRDYDVWSNSPTPPSPIKIKTNLVDTRETYQRRRYVWYLYICGIWAHWDRKFHTLYSFGWERVKFVLSWFNTLQICTITDCIVFHPYVIIWSYCGWHFHNALTEHIADLYD